MSGQTFIPLPNSPPQDGSEPSQPAPKQQKFKKRDVHGWIVLDKPIGMTSTHAVAVIKRLFSAKRAGHAGTLDPLASGCLPIALGEATKTVPFVVDSRKTYLFTVRWGEERDTDDAEGRVVATSENRPDAAAIRAELPRFTGTIEQVPPRFSAVKIDGERAYDLARDGEIVELAAAVRVDPSPGTRRNARSRPCHVCGRMRQRHLCPLAGARSGPGAGRIRPCLGAAPRPGRAVRRNGHDFAGTPGIFVP